MYFKDCLGTFILSYLKHEVIDDVPIRYCFNLNNKLDFRVRVT